MIHLRLRHASPIDHESRDISLSSTEIARASRFRSSRARSRYLASHVWAREAVAKLLDLAPADVPFRTDERGALSLAGMREQVSLSHHGDWLALAVSTGEPVGVDVLSIPPHADFIDDTSLVLSAAEIDWVKSQAPNFRGAAFALTWVRKEAYAKFRGSGLTADLAGVTLTPDAGVTGASFWTRRLPDAVVAVATTSGAEVVVRDTAAALAQAWSSTRS